MGNQSSGLTLNQTNFTFQSRWICTNAARKFIPKRRLTDKKSNKMPRTRRILMRRRTRVIKQLSAVKTDSKKKKLTDETIQIERKLKQSYRQEKSEMEQQSPEIASTSSAMPRNSDIDNKVISCPQKMADMLVKQYNSVFSIPKEKPISPSQGIFQCGSHLQDGWYISDIEFSVKDIEEAISDISTTAVAGPDRFPAILLKQCKIQLAKPLFVVWRTSMDQVLFPIY